MAKGARGEPDNIAESVLRQEAAAIIGAADRLDHDGFARAVELVRNCTGKVLTTGAGTSGIIARKIAATLTSTGTPSLFLHPSDALHGGLGVVESDDVVIAISNSGETGEILVTLPYLRHRDVALIALVGNISSTLALAADAVLDAGVEHEAGPLNLAPTSSTTVALAVGDALAMSVLATSPFTPEAFARNHPAGRLGRRLTLRVEDVIAGPLPRPVVDPTATLLDAIGEIGAGGVGAVLVMDADGVLRGIITDGDVRRALQAGVTDPATTMAVDVMTERPISIAPGTLAYQALQEMEDRPSQISIIPIVDPATGQCAGLVRVHDLVRAGI